VKILLDTSYLLPFIKVDIEGISRDKLRKTISAHEIQVSQVQIFELYAKGMKYILRGNISPQDILEGVDAVSNFQVISIHDADILTLSAYLRRKLDTIDAIILSSAVYYSQALATMDSKILGTKNDPEILRVNPKIQIFSL
jgi:PIN domain nuclease of toxin-antitoxin system